MLQHFNNYILLQIENKHSLFISLHSKTKMFIRTFSSIMIEAFLFSLVTFPYKTKQLRHISIYLVQ